MTLSFRRARAEDAAAIADVHIASWEAVYEALLPSEILAELTTEIVTSRWELELARVSSDDSQVWVAEFEPDVAAYSRFGSPRDEDSIAAGNVGEIYGLYVHPHHWGAGVGRGLLERVIGVFRGSGLARVTLNVVAANTPARAFYERMGFTADGPAAPWYGVDQLRYSREL